MPVQWLARIVRQRWSFLPAFAPSSPYSIGTRHVPGRDRRQVGNSCTSRPRRSPRPFTVGWIKPDSRIFHRTTQAGSPSPSIPSIERRWPPGPPSRCRPPPRKQWPFFGTEAPGRQIDETLGAAVSQPRDERAAPKAPRGPAGALFSRKTARAAHRLLNPRETTVGQRGRALTRAGRVSNIPRYRETPFQACARPAARRHAGRGARPQACCGPSPTRGRSGASPTSPASSKLSKPTAYRLLAALEGEGLVVRQEPAGAYRLGPTAIELGARAQRAQQRGRGRAPGDGVAHPRHGGNVERRGARGGTRR